MKKDFLDEIIACLIARREEWDINGTALRHKSGVLIFAESQDLIRFDPPFALNDTEKTRIYEVIKGLRRQHIIDRLGVTEVTERADIEHLKRVNQMFFANVLHSLRSDPDNWSLSSNDKGEPITLNHVNGISIWAANSVTSRDFYKPSLKLADPERKMLDEALEQHKRYQVLRQINEKLPKLETHAKTWGSRCPFCLEKPEKKCYRCECDILLHYDCAVEAGKCPVCSQEFLFKPLLPQVAEITPIGPMSIFNLVWDRFTCFLGISRERTRT